MVDCCSQQPFLLMFLALQQDQTCRKMIDLTLVRSSRGSDLLGLSVGLLMMGMTDSNGCTPAAGVSLQDETAQTGCYAACSRSTELLG